VTRPKDTFGEDDETQAMAAIPFQRDGTQATRTSHPGQSGSVSASGPEGSASATSPADVMRLAEVARTRMVIRSGWVLGAVTIAALPLLSGDRTVRWVFTGAIVAAIAHGIVLDRIFRDPARFSHRKLLGLGLTMVVVVYSGILYFGVFSAAPVLMVMGLSVYSRTEGSALLFFIVVVVVQAVLSTIVIAGVIEDPGLFPVVDTP